ncbi:MAG: NAD(P)/FAD-dependent oxidoreductase [Bacteroidota bacterium]
MTDARNSRIKHYSLHITQSKLFVLPSQMTPPNYDVIIIGGSYSGLSAAMALGRSLRKVLVIDSGLPCNRQTPHSHNFITHDGRKPAEIAALAKEQLTQYSTIDFHNGIATKGKKVGDIFEITTEADETFHGSKLIFATGIRDILPNIPGFAECWGISVIHCPYCHGYEVRNKKTGVLANGDVAFEYVSLISNWTKDLTLFTNGKSTLSSDQTRMLGKHNINVIEKEVQKVDHNDGQVRSVIFKDNSEFILDAVYARVPFEQHCPIPQQLGCELTELRYIKTDAMQRTNIPGVYACGDNASPMRTVANAVSAGTATGMMLNKEMVVTSFI